MLSVKFIKKYFQGDPWKKNSRRFKENQGVQGDPPWIQGVQGEWEAWLECFMHLNRKEN